MKKRVLSVIVIAVILVSALSCFAYAQQDVSPFYNALKTHVLENGTKDEDSGAFYIPLYTEPTGLVVILLYSPEQNVLGLGAVSFKLTAVDLYVTVFNKELSGLYQYVYLETAGQDIKTMVYGYLTQTQTKDSDMIALDYEGDENAKQQVGEKAKNMRNVCVVAFSSYIDQNDIGHFTDFGFNDKFFCTGGHTFGEFTYNNDATHEKDGTNSRLCSECLYLETVTAEGTKRLDLPHTLKKMSDYYTHWTGCDCGYKEDEVAHRYIAECVSTCEDCGYNRGYATAHIYDKSKLDDKYHWKECACGDTAHKTKHIYDHGFDVDCSFCGYVRVAPNTGSKEFADVSKSAWYKYYVDYAVTYGLYKGTDDNHFSPNGEMTRAQFVQVLANLSGMTLNNNTSSGFSDVPSGKWFTGAVTWAVKNGIAKGVGSGKFDPNGKIDRQQMCTMLVNYVENYKNTSLNKKVTYKPFADDKDIAAWAKSGVIKCFEAGLVTGTGNNRFSPKVVANRATGATIFTNFHKEYIK